MICKIIKDLTFYQNERRNRAGLKEYLNKQWQIISLTQQKRDTYRFYKLSNSNRRHPNKAMQGSIIVKYVKNKDEEKNLESGAKVAEQVAPKVCLSTETLENQEKQ